MSEAMWEVWLGKSRRLMKRAVTGVVLGVMRRGSLDSYLICCGVLGPAARGGGVTLAADALVEARSRSERAEMTVSLLLLGLAAGEFSSFRRV